MLSSEIRPNYKPRPNGAQRLVTLTIFSKEKAMVKTTVNSHTYFSISQEQKSRGFHVANAKDA